MAYTCVARQYQYRERDEPDNIYCYAEEYYANAQDEPDYDYDDYDNLDVHTINNNWHRLLQVHTSINFLEIFDGVAAKLFVESYLVPQKWVPSDGWI